MKVMSVRPKISRRYFAGRCRPKLWSKAFWLLSIGLVLLQSNKMNADGKRLDAETGKQIVLHPNWASGVAAAGQESKP